MPMLVRLVFTEYTRCVCRKCGNVSSITSHQFAG